MKDWQSQDQLPRSFHEVARSVYRDDPNWIPEEPSELEVAFGPTNPYFSRCSVCVAFEPQVARLAGFFDPKLIIDGRPVAFFGYWETKEDYDANERLFRDFEDWAREKGARAAYGPVNFTTFGNYRIRLDHFEAGCFFGEPYNPPYYQRLLERLGYTLAHQYMSITGRLEDALNNLEGKLPSPLQAAETLGLRLIRVTPDYWLDNITRFHTLSDVIYSRNIGYTGIDLHTFERWFGRSFAERFCPRSSVVALDSNDEVAGFVISFPDYSPLCRQGAPDRVPVSRLNYREHFRLLASPMGIAKSGGVHPRHRKEGLYWILNHTIALWARDDYVFAAGSTMPADNPSLVMAKEVFNKPTDIVRWYGLFSKPLV